MATFRATVSTADPYGAATRIDANERQRMGQQFTLHTLPVLDPALRAAAPAGEIPLLDVGSGHGAVICAFGAGRSRPTEIRLLDGNPELLMLAQRRLHKAGLPARSYHGAIDGSSLPTSMCSNDIVLLSFTATHLLDLETGLRNVTQALRPGGWP
jgi:ubiquinone/menaquinone biosynthesis C-methylase UbiE